jgi:hypothetical protein
VIGFFGLRFFKFGLGFFEFGFRFLVICPTIGGGKDGFGGGGQDIRGSQSAWCDRWHSCAASVSCPTLFVVGLAGASKSLGP